MVAAIVQRTAIDERQTYSCCLAEFVKGQSIGEHLLQIQETPDSNCTCRVSISEGRLPLWRGWLRWGGRSRSVAKNVNAVITWFYISNQQFRSLIQLSGCQCSQKYQVTLIFFSGQPEETVVMARPQFITEPLTMMVNEGDVIRWSTWSWSWRIWWWWW